MLKKYRGLSPGGKASLWLIGAMVMALFVVLTFSRGDQPPAMTSSTSAPSANTSTLQQPSQAFAQQIKDLIESKKGRDGAATISKQEVEQIGTSLGMSKDEASGRFFNLKGVLWTLGEGDLLSDLVQGSDDRKKEWPQDWTAVDKVVLV